MSGYQYVYHLGAMLLDMNDPSKVIARAKASILSPREPYERVGLTSNIVFTSGAILEEDGEVKIYYGGADTVQCVATACLDDLVEACFSR
jgi:beta-1,4-mannooligosaccharide/beta-1,4-mannosyl-N-acetylglucosamine phosphorylase